MRLFRAGVDGKSAPFQIMTKFEIPNFFDVTKNYLTRWRLIQTPWFGIYLHRMDGPDFRPILHDHPWAFVSFILKGGYREVRLDKLKMIPRIRDVKRLNVMRRDDAHWIDYLLRVPTWTLVFVGRRRRTWGYWEPVQSIEAPTLQWYWTEFDKHPCSVEFDRALELRRKLGKRNLLDNPDFQMTQGNPGSRWGS